ncbi:cation transporter [Candidatus Magnetomonas plexicatena]|uniref:cation transporter n=1 Tax=Candidatus Magnetomonas plexicatena TaxID=2552947 RepID=UPI001C78551C|nr:cation transporter [Nitrospirales bacterium LBB_01]
MKVSLKDREGLLGLAYLLSVITVFYNIIEGVVSVYFGLDDDTMSLFGFGLDSFAEVVSGIGIWHMVVRMKGDAGSNTITQDAFEETALKVTGRAFYVLAAGLAITSVYNFIAGKKPVTTIAGIVVAIVSIVSMLSLIHYKTRVGKALGSEAILSDAACTRTCLYLSVVLLAASVGYEVTKIAGLDSIGAIAIAAFSVKEGKEALDKAKNKGVCACSSCGCSK